MPTKGRQLRSDEKACFVFFVFFLTQICKAKYEERKKEVTGDKHVSFLPDLAIFFPQRPPCEYRCIFK